MKQSRWKKEERHMLNVPRGMRCLKAAIYNRVRLSTGSFFGNGGISEMRRGEEKDMITVLSTRAFGTIKNVECRCGVVGTKAKCVWRSTDRRAAVSSIGDAFITDFQ